ncbi:MAG: PDZ domain-containing protein [Desulfuromonadales bacterium]|nr:PDZ domain-containing protein [Desulfuromonadales bacterium]
MKIAKVVMVMLLMLIAAGCTTMGGNGYAEYYHDRTGGIDVTTNPDVIPYNDEPKQFEPKTLKGKNSDEDNQLMLEDGYLLLGFSSFNARYEYDSNAMKHGKDIHAEIVVCCYSKYTGTKTGTMPIVRTYTHGNQIHYKTIYEPYTYNTYDFYASYWAKLKPPILGLQVIDLNDEQRKELNSNKGVAVLAVIKGSPAFMADLLKGDIIRKIGDINLYDAQTFQYAEQKYNGQKVNIIYMRDGMEAEKEIQFNKRDGTEEVQFNYKPAIFGLSVKELNNEQRKELDSNKGVIVLSAVKGSPAYLADFLKGDIIRKIGDIDLYDAKSYDSALQKYDGQKVNVIFIRDGKEMEKEIQFNTRPPILGMQVIDLNDEQRNQLKNKGIIVSDVIKGSPAYKAGLLKGDIIIKIDDIDVHDVQSFQSLEQKYEGQKVEITYMRDGKKIEQDIQFNSKPE